MGLKNTMDTLQRAMHRWLDELPALLLADLIDQKLRAQGVSLAKRKRIELANAILQRKTDNFAFIAGRKDRDKKLTIDFTDADYTILENQPTRLLTACRL